MREFPYIIRDELVNGLRPNARMRRGEKYLVEAYNVLPTRYGLDLLRDITDPFEGLEPVSFPFPQILRGYTQTLLAGATSLKVVNEAVLPWERTNVTTYDPTNPAATKAIVAGGPWHFADMGDTYLLFNGSCVVFRSAIGRLNSAADKTFVATDVPMQTGCYSRGRVIVGGFTGQVWNSEWQALFSSWTTPVEAPTKSYNDIGENYVMWSSIGGGDFPLWLFNTADYTYDLGMQEAYLIEKIRLNEFGWMPLPCQGTVRCLLPLGGHVIAYADDCVVALTPVPGSGDVPSTYSPRRIAPVGIASRGAATGDDNGHVFVDSSGAVWRITPDLQTVRLGYEEYTFDLLGGDIVLAKDPAFGDVYLSGEASAFVLTETGMAEHKNRLCSLHFVGGGLVGLVDEVDLDTKDEIRVVTAETDLSTGGIKTITWIHLHMRSVYDVRVAVDYRYARSDEYVRSEFVPVNDEGVARIDVAGVDFRIVVKATNISDLIIDSIDVRWQASDKRYRRGPDAGAFTPSAN